MEELAQKIYKLLTNRKFRAGPLPPENTKNLIIEKISSKVLNNFPIKIFMFWGGCKNPNLPCDKAESCEELTLDNYKNLNIEIKKIYKPGVKVYLSPGDYRVEKVNLIPHEKTKIYVESLIELCEKEKYQDLFSVIPLSTLYHHNQEKFEKKLHEAEKRISNKIIKIKNFEKLVINARKNIFNKEFLSEGKIHNKTIEAAKNYIIYRVAEEETQLFSEFKDCIRAFFIKYAPFYKPYIKDVNQTIPHLDCCLVFYTGGKGNITQPWQAIGKKIDGKIFFLSQERLRNLNPSLN